MTEKHWGWLGSTRSSPLFAMHLHFIDLWMWKPKLYTYLCDREKRRDIHTPAICQLGVERECVVWEVFDVSSQVPRTGSSSRWLALQIKTKNKKQNSGAYVHACPSRGLNFPALFSVPVHIFIDHLRCARVCINLQHVRLIDLRRRRRPSVTQSSCSSRSSSSRSTEGPGNVIHSLLGSFSSNALR